MITQRTFERAGGRTGLLLMQIAVLGAAAAALGLRLHRLSAQSFWYDEGISVVLAGRSLLQITRDAAADIHPPVYYYVLHLWVKMAGDSEFAVRFVSVATGVLAVCLVFRLGCRLFSPGSGLAAAVFLAAAPLAVYYGQEARMYSLLLALTSLWTLVWLRLLDGDSALQGRAGAARWAAYLALGLLSVYTHYFAFLLLAFHGLWTLLVRVRHPRLLGRWAAVQGAIVLAYVPWVLNMSFGQLDSFRRGAEQPSPSEVLWRMVDDFTLGHLAVPDEAVRTIFLSLLAIGLVYALVRSPQGGLIALLYLCVPLVAMLALSTIRPAYQARLVLLATPGFYLLLGHGVAALGDLARWGMQRLRVGTPAAVLVGAGALGVALTPLVGSLEALYGDEGWQRDNFRGVVRHIVAEAAPDDAIVLNSPGQIDIFGYYFRGPQAYYPLPAQLPIDETRTEADLADVARRHPGVWAILWGTSETDPGGVVERWLDSHSYKTINTWFGGIRLARYVVEETGERQPLDLRLGENIRLTGYAWQTREGQPGDVLPLTLYWEAIAPIDRRYKVFVHVLDDDEKIWGQRDSEPSGGANPTVDWRPGEEVEDRIGVPLQTDAAPGRYEVEIGMYDPTTMERPDVFGAAGEHLGNRVLIGPIEVK